MEIGDRIEILQQEYQAAGQELRQHQQRIQQLQVQMIRIEGAISVLNDLQSGQKEDDASEQLDRSEPSESTAT